jgi:hypothetical protein
MRTNLADAVRRAAEHAGDEPLVAGRPPSLRRSEASRRGDVAARDLRIVQPRSAARYFGTTALDTTNTAPRVVDACVGE